MLLHREQVHGDTEFLIQGINQDLATGCQKLATVKFWGCTISSINMYLLTEIKHIIFIRCHGNHIIESECMEIQNF